MKQFKEQLSINSVPETSKKEIPTKCLHLTHLTALKRCPSHQTYYSPTDFAYLVDRWKLSLSDQSFKIFLSEIKKRFKIHNWQNFKRLFLNLDCMKDLESLDSKIDRYCPKLNHLSICLPMITNGINEKGAKSWIQGICENVRNLKVLSLDFRDCEASYPDEWKLLAKSIFRYAYGLQALRLTFPWADTDDRSLEALAFQIKKSRINLQRLDINLNYCDEITLLGFQELGTAIAKGLPNLKALRVHFEIDVDIPEDIGTCGECADGCDQEDENCMKIAIERCCGDKAHERRRIEGIFRKMFKSKISRLEILGKAAFCDVKHNVLNF